MQVVGSMLVRDDDVYVERALRNVASVCDRIHVLDHMSRDRTPEILRTLAEELDHLEVQRSGNAAASHPAAATVRRHGHLGARGRR